MAEIKTQPAPTVLYEERGAVAMATLNRPPTLNSLSVAMFRELRAVMLRAETNPVIRAFVLTGAGRAFCAGGDLSELDLRPGDDLVALASPGPMIAEEVNPTVRQMQALRMPTLAAVNGAWRPVPVLRWCWDAISPSRRPARRLSRPSARSG